MFDLGCFLLVECNYLPKIPFLLFLWLLRIFVLCEWIFNPTLSVLCLKSHNIFLKLHQRSRDQEHVARKAQVCEAIRFMIT